MAGKWWGAGLFPEVCVLWMNGEKDAGPTRRQHFTMWKAGCDDPAGGIETFAPETRLCAGESGAKSVPFKPDLSPPAPYMAVLWTSEVGVWRQSFLCCDASQKKVMVQKVWLKGTEYEVMASTGEEQSNSECGCEHVRGGCGRRDPTWQLFRVPSLSRSFCL